MSWKVPKPYLCGPSRKAWCRFPASLPVWWFTAQKSKPSERQLLVERENAFIRKASNLGRRWTHVPRPTLKILLSHDSFYMEKKNLSESLRRKFGFCIILHCMQTGWLSSDVLLPQGSACRITKGAVRGTELVIS